MKGIALSLAVAVCLTGSVQAQLTQLWHYQGQVNGSNWRSIAIGASGSQIVSNPDGGSGAVALFAGSDGPASPLIWSDNSAAQARTGIVAAASRDDAYANLYFNPVTGSGQSFVPRLTLRRSGNSATVWAKTYDAITISSTSILAGLHVARDGQKLVAWWFDHGQGKTFVVGYTASGTQNFAVALLTYVPPQASAADEDARRVALVYGNVTLVLDGTTGVQVKSIYPSQGSSSAVAFGPNADTLAIGNVNGAVDVFRTGTALLGYAYTIPAVPSQVSRCATFSTDGSTLAVAYQSNLDIASHLLRIFTPGATNAVQVHQHAMHGNGSFISFITDVAVSDDGRVVAACTTGDQAQQLPSVLAFTRTPTGYILRGSAVLPGTAYDIDLSPDGRKAAVASSTMHYAMSTAVGAVDAFDVDGDLSVAGVPHAGTTVQVQMKTTPGLPCLLYMSNALHATPMDYGGMGTLLLQSPVRIGSTFADAQGVAHFDFSVPGGAAAWGDTYYTQGMTLIQRKLTQSYVPITVVP